MAAADQDNDRNTLERRMLKELLIEQLEFAVNPGMSSQRRPPSRLIKRPKCSNVLQNMLAEIEASAQMLPPDPSSTK